MNPTTTALYIEILVSGYISFIWIALLVKHFLVGGDFDLNIFLHSEIMNISKEFTQIGIIFGTPQVNEKNIGNGLFNSAFLIYKGNILFKQNKSLLPTYDVFDETRYFDKESDPKIIKFKEEYLGISICEDAWSDPKLWPKRYYPFDPQESLANKGATVLINISAWSAFCLYRVSPSW